MGFGVWGLGFGFGFGDLLAKKLVKSMHLGDRLTRSDQAREQTCCKCRCFGLHANRCLGLRAVNNDYTQLLVLRDCGLAMIRKAEKVTSQIPRNSIDKCRKMHAIPRILKQSPGPSRRKAEKMHKKRVSKQASRNAENVVNTEAPGSPREK